MYLHVLILIFRILLPYCGNIIETLAVWQGYNTDIDSQCVRK
jgi:hypothetical protein